MADSIQSKVRALGGAIAVLGGTGALVTNLAEQFGLLDKSQAAALDKTFSLLAATGSLITIFARLIPILQGVAAVQTIANAARAVALALSGPVGWAILGGAAVALAAFGIYMATKPTGGETGPPEPVHGSVGGQFGVDTIVSGRTLFMAGEAGRERVTITPEGRGASGTGVTANIHIYGVSDSEAAARAAKRELEILIERERIRRS